MFVGKARVISLCLGAGIFVWALLYLTTPHFSDLEPFPDFPRHPHAPPPPPSPPPPYSLPKPPTFWNSRAEEVKSAFLHAYTGYTEFALNHDELLPLSNSSTDNFNGWGVTLIDAVDTMWIMGLHDQFYQATSIIANMTFSLTANSYAPFFETVIRYLGGLLSAYALSKEPIFLSRADDLGRMLLPVFNTTMGLPMYAVNTITGETRSGWSPGTVLWAEALSCQLEYKYLAHLTGRREYYDSVEHIMNIMLDANVTDGMFPTRWRLSDATPSNTQFSVGAFADSAHEYLLKQWLLTSRSETKAHDLYIRAINGILHNLLYLSPTRKLLYVTDTERGYPSHTFEHLSCFLPGLLTLGAHTLPLSSEDKQLHIWAAQGLAHTCWITYADQPTGLGPDEIIMDRWPSIDLSNTQPHTPEFALSTGRWWEHVHDWEAKGRPGGIPPGLSDASPVTTGLKDYISRKPGYLLRPEAVESFYLMWRTTGDDKWRDRGWAVFEAIQKEAKTPVGYASVKSVEQSPAGLKDEMPSFFLAETLKYLYLLFTDEELIPLDRWVFNTEAHPLPIFEWSKWDKERYGILALS